MKLSSYQAQLLLAILWHSCRICGDFGGLSETQRVEFYNQILNQQSTEIVDLEAPPATPSAPPGAA